ITSHSMEECEALCNRLTIMVNGEMKCLGTLQHLKNKFGSGYTLVVKHKQDPEAIINHVKHHFPLSDIRRAHAGILSFKVPQNGISLADVFECME
ncbi:hypothetical protein, partial [Salmonella sp. s51228]|uniref:hypothetical protein n=1 Tax=Salmonella sp. s51228 TaxID=3159652 RepID=UPI00397FD6BB